MPTVHVRRIQFSGCKIVAVRKKGVKKALLHQSKYYDSFEWGPIECLECEKIEVDLLVRTIDINDTRKTELDNWTNVKPIKTTRY